MLQSRKAEGSSAKGKMKKDGALVWAVPPELENFNVGCFRHLVLRCSWRYPAAAAGALCVLRNLKLHAVSGPMQLMGLATRGFGQSCHDWQLARPLPCHEQAQQAWADQACGVSDTWGSSLWPSSYQVSCILQENGQAVTAKGRETMEQPPLNFVVGAHREAFAAVANKHLAAVVAQLLAAEGIQDVATWCPLITQMGQQAAQALSPSAMAAHGVSDPRHYIKVGAAVCHFLQGLLHPCLPPPAGPGGGVAAECR